MLPSSTPVARSLLTAWKDRHFNRLGKGEQMKIKITAGASHHGWEIGCCNKEDVKITKSRSGRCYTELWLKCKLCGTHGKFKYWHTEAFKPSSEDRKLGYEQIKAHTDYYFEVGRKDERNI